MNNTATREELKAILDEWIPKYIRQVVELRSGSRLSAERYNELMNLLITQGDDTIELAETVKQYMEILVADEEAAREEFTQSITQSLNETTAKVTNIAETAVDTADSAVSSVNQYKAVMDTNMEQFKNTVNSTVSQIGNDIVSFKESVTQSIADSDARVNSAVETANQLTADMEAYRTELTQLTEKTFTDMQTALSQQVSDNVTAGIASLKDELIGDINTTISELEEQVMTIANTAEQAVNSAVQDIEAYKANMDVRLDAALKEVEDSLSVAGEVIQDAGAIYAKINEIDELVKTYDTRINAVEAYIETGDAKTLDGHGAEYFATAVDLSNYFPNSGGKLTDNVVIEKNGNSEVRYELKNGNKNVSFVIASDGSYGIYEVGRGWLLLFDANGNRSFDGTASGNLSSTGGSVKGEVNFEDTSVDNPNGKTRVVTTNNGCSYFVNESSNGVIRQIAIDNVSNCNDIINAIMFWSNESGDWQGYNILHTGNIASHVTPSAIGASATGHTHDDRYYTETEVNNLLTNKAASTHTHTKSQITDFPTSLPASDVYAWAKASAKPSYTWNEITSKPTSFTPAAHNQSASTITVGTFAGQVKANTIATATLGEAQVRDVYAGTDDMTAGSSSLVTGRVYLVYE